MGATVQSVAMERDSTLVADVSAHGPAAARPHDPRKAEFETNKLRKRLRRLVGEAIADYAHDRARATA